MKKQNSFLHLDVLIANSAVFDNMTGQQSFVSPLTVVLVLAVLGNMARYDISRC